MSSEFWWGMAAIPVAALAVAVVFVAVVAVIFASERWSVGEYKLWPHRPSEYNQELLPAVVACAKWSRYLWVPGWHVVICRTTLTSRDDAADIERHRKVRWAVRDALADSKENG